MVDFDSPVLSMTVRKRMMRSVFCDWDFMAFASFGAAIKKGRWITVASPIGMAVICLRPC